MERKANQECPVSFLEGGYELGQATGIAGEKTHAKWRRAGLKYSIADDGTFLYDPADVTKFIKRYYAPRKPKKPLKA